MSGFQAMRCGTLRLWARKIATHTIFRRSFCLEVVMHFWSKGGGAPVRPKPPKECSSASAPKERRLPAADFACSFPN